MTRQLRAVVLSLTVLAVHNAARAYTGRTEMEMFKTPLYAAEGDGFVRHNGGWFNNRPLYCNQTNAVVITGDRPLIRFGEGNIQSGSFIVAVVRGDKAKWLHDFSDITSRYRADHMRWLVKDDAFGPTTITLDVVPSAEGAGVAIRLKAAQAQPGDRLIWCCGGAVPIKAGMTGGWDITTGAWSRADLAKQSKLKTTFVPQDCRGNQVTLADGTFTIALDAPRGGARASGSCSETSKISVADAAAWADPLKLPATAGADTPVACGVIDLDRAPDVYWSMQVQKADGKVALAPPAEVFASGMKRVEELGSRVVVDTPDARLNAEVAVSNAVIDGVFRDGIFTHSGMRWGVPLLGWRTVYGGTVYGWHDRVKTQAQLCFAKQITEVVPGKTEPRAEAKYGLTSQAPESMMFGKGRVDLHHPSHYDMQTQFFDQMIHAWRATGDPEFEKMLRPALELHLDYIHDCFDPDDDGLYESYANTWPTDDQWYNGGGTAEETAYAYTGEKAAAELAHRAGDEANAKKHEARLAKIQKNFMDKLWVASTEHVGAYVEQGGHERLHDDCWLYAIFCPIDSGMLDPEHAAKSLYYTEWGLEREAMPYGGERCWTSNWVPSKWSLREMWPGDCYGLALAYYQTGLPQEGWEVLRGTFPAMAFYGPVPGDLGHPNGGTDFNDCASMFCRTVVEGMFGYKPDYPNSTVTIAPQLPAEWAHASIKTPDFSLRFDQGAYQVTLATPAAMELHLPVRARKLSAVRVNGQPAHWELRPGFGCSIAKISVPRTNQATVQMTCDEPLPQYAPTKLELASGQKPNLDVPGAAIVTPGTLPDAAGFHLVDELVQVGDAPQHRLFKIKVTDSNADAAAAQKTFDKPPAGARWASVDLSGLLNGDIRTIFKQQYLSPRPNTCSLRLGTDGYSTWQEMLGPNGTAAESRAPAIDLKGAAALLDTPGQLRTPQGVLFAWSGGERNIAFTSMWDNWPRQVTVPLNRQADGVSLLLCGFTNPMQCRIANAEVRMKYADGVVEKVELVPPLNFWSLCHFGGADYNYQRDGFCLPTVPPPLVQLGDNCRANLLNVRLRSGVKLESVTLETVSQEVIIGLMGISLMNPQ